MNVDTFVAGFFDELEKAASAASLAPKVPHKDLGSRILEAAKSFMSGRGGDLLKDLASSYATAKIHSMMDRSQQRQQAEHATQRDSFLGLGGGAVY